jgi:hypothetical protein
MSNSVFDTLSPMEAFMARNDSVIDSLMQSATSDEISEFLRVLLISAELRHKLNARSRPIILPMLVIGELKNVVNSLDKRTGTDDVFSLYYQCRD